ncbi:MAG: STAS domain-containing protein [Fuerstiella sp.]
MSSNLTRQTLFNCCDRDNVMVLRLTADLRACHYHEKQEEYNQLMRQLCDRTSPRLLFDLSECRILDSVTVGIMLALSKAAIRENGAVGLSSVSARIERILSRLMLLEPRHRQLTWDVYPDVDQAIVRLSAL